MWGDELRPASTRICTPSEHRLTVLSSPVLFAPLKQCQMHCRWAALRPTSTPPSLVTRETASPSLRFPWGCSRSARTPPSPVPFRLRPLEPPWQTRPTHPSPRPTFSSAVMVPVVWAADGPALASPLSSVRCPLRLPSRCSPSGRSRLASPLVGPCLFPHPFSLPTPAL
jgi:hypothetical protein